MWMLYIAMLVIGVPIMIYLYRFLKRICETFKVSTDKKSIRIVLWVLAVILGLLCTNIFGLGAIIVLHIVVIAWVMQLINFIIKKACKEKYRDGFKVWKFIYGSGMVSFVVTAILVTYGYINMHNVVETDYTIYTEKTLENDYRVALIADVHFSVSINLDELAEKCDEITSKNPDIVILCGDIVDENTSKEDMKSVFEKLGSIKSTYGTFYVYGNHDRQLYRTSRAYTEDELSSAIKNNGITILQDELVGINDDLIIAGREDKSYDVVKVRATVEELLKDADKDKFILTLDHQPKDYKKNAQAGTDLLLSGHTHGGQIWPAQFLFAIAKFDDAVYGYTLIDTAQAIVTSGLAGWGYPVKTAAPAEYVIIDIKSK